MEDDFPDVHSLFLHYDRLYFNDTLSSHAVAIEWSTRMTL
jgi:hypothetical protein